MTRSSQNHLKTEVLVVGAGPAGLACAIRLARAGRAKSILVLEKSARPGGHLLSGAVLRPEPLERLLTPAELAAVPLGPLVVRDSFHALFPRASLRLPFVPPKMRMKGLPLVSAAALGRALCAIATDLGVEILHGQTADALLWNGDRVAGVRSQGDSILADATVLAEGPVALLARELYARQPRLRGPNPQTYGLGFKELFEVPAVPGSAGTVVHTFGHPLGLSTYGGGFIYRVDDAHLALGLAIALDYADPSLHLHDLFRQWKRHPFVQAHLAGGKPIEYGARLVPEGGWHSRCAMHAPGAYVVGDAAGLVDAMELKGLHLAIESGIAAADAILRGDAPRAEDVPSLDGLRRTPNYRAAFRAGLPLGMAAAGLAWLTGGRLPGGRLPQRGDRNSLRPARGAPPASGAPDRSPLDLGMDSDLFLAHLRHRQGAEHIEIKSPPLCRDCFKTYAAPCLRFCPAAVYAQASPDPAILVRPENCLQCGCCTLKCPFDNILWDTPRHGVGPDYRQL
jgi:electron-transferring-flavoprotein dehydrogenase